MEIKFRIEGGTSHSNMTNEVSFHLRVNDDTSGTCLMDVQLSPEEWLRLTNGTSLTVDGGISPHLDRVGRKMVHRMVNVPKDVVTSYQRDEAEEQIRAWAKDQRVEGETVEPRNSNSGWKVIFRSWPVR
jgi:hypothetical protein